MIHNCSTLKLSIAHNLHCFDGSYDKTDKKKFESIIVKHLHYNHT